MLFMYGNTLTYMFNLGFGDFVKENIYLFIYLAGSGWLLHLRLSRCGAQA